MTLEVKLRFSGVKCSLCSVSVCVFQPCSPRRENFQKERGKDSATSVSSERAWYSNYFRSAERTWSSWFSLTIFLLNAICETKGPSFELDLPPLAFLGFFSRPLLTEYLNQTPNSPPFLCLLLLLLPHLHCPSVSSIDPNTAVLSCPPGDAAHTHKYMTQTQKETWNKTAIHTETQRLGQWIFCQLTLTWNPKPSNYTLTTKIIFLWAMSVWFARAQMYLSCKCCITAVLKRGDAVFPQTTNVIIL